MKTVRTSKIQSAIYIRMLRDKLRFIDQRIIGPLHDIGIIFESNGESAYTFLSGGKFKVCLGGKLARNIAEAPETFSSKEKYKPYHKDLLAAMYGLNYHEMGHVKFTDMANREIAEYPKVQYRGLIHTLFNITEDPIIEIAMSRYYKENYPLERNPKLYFDYMISKLFLPQCATYKDNGSFSAFMQYLLLSLRCGRSALPETNKVFEKYSYELLPRLKDIIYENDATERIHKNIKLAEWMIENISEFSDEFKKMAEPPDHHPVEKSDIKPEKTGISSSDLTPMDEAPEGGHDEEDEKTEDSEESKGEEGEKDKTEAPETDESEGEPEDFDSIFDDNFADGADHEWVIAKDEYVVKDESIRDDLDNYIQKYADAINDISKFLTLFKGRKKPKLTPGYRSGKLNVSRALQNEMREGCDLNLFSRKYARGQNVDLAVSLLVDNSGSMSGKRSQIASQAALVLAQACEWSDIPFECNAFTKTQDCSSGTSITIKEKTFDDSFESAKPYFGINDSTTIHKLEADRSIPTFHGNSEEINLYYIWQELKLNPHKTKLLFVMCDGMTTGSSMDLKDVVNSMMNDGIIVIGIGLMCDTVQKIYPLSKLFSSVSELQEGLAPYLIDTLSQYAV